MRSRALTLARVATRTAVCSSAAPRPAAPWQRLQRRQHSPWSAAASAADGSAGGGGVADGDDDDGGRTTATKRPRPSSPSSPSPPTTKPRHVRLPAHWACPACGTRCVRPAVFARHLRACCPDLVAPDAWRSATRNAEAGVFSSRSDRSSRSDPSSTSPSLPPEAVEEAEALLVEAGRAEEALRERILVLSFGTLESLQSQGGPPTFSRMPIGDVARRLGLPEKRVASSLRAAVRATPLVADDVDGSDIAAALPAPVVYEDDDVIAFAKPSGIITAPKHRHEGGSLVSRAIAHLNRDGRSCRSGRSSDPGDSLSAAGTGTEVVEAKAVTKARRYPFPVHRLDMATSGVVVMGKTSAAAAALQSQFRLRTARKIYLAVVAGGEVGGEGSGDGGVGGGRRRREVGETWEVDAAIGRHPDLKVGRRAVVASGDGGRSSRRGERRAGEEEQSGDGEEEEAAQPALTRFVVLSQCDGSAVERALRRAGPRSSSPPPFSSLFSLGALAPADATERALRRGAALLACAPRTGRTHQIRVHSALCGLPILGDEIYGATFPGIDGEGRERRDGERPLAPRLLLHAAALELDHPSSLSASSPPAAAKRLRLSAPLPVEFETAMRALGIEDPPVDLFEGLPRSLWD